MGGHLLKLQSFKFLLCIILSQQVFSITKILHQQLQAKNIDLQLVLYLGYATVKLREFGSNYEFFFDKVLELATECQIDLPHVQKVTRKTSSG